MAVALAVDIFIFFQHLIKIQGPVHGKLNIPFEEIFHRQMERIHHLVKHLIGIVCKIHKISAFQTVILLLAAVTVQNIQEFLRRKIFRRNIQIQKSALDRYSHGHFHLLRYLKV